MEVNSMFLDEISNFNERHLIPSPVTFVNVFHPFAGEIVALKAVVNGSLLRTFFYFAFDAAGALMDVVARAARTLFFPCQMSVTNAAVQSAWRNHLFLHGFNLHKDIGGIDF
jgi:hypothetical protein